MKWPSKSKIKIASILFAVLFLINTITFLLFGLNKESSTIIYQHPSYHFVPEITFNWVVIDDKTWNRVSEPQQATMVQALLKINNKVYIEGVDSTSNLCSKWDGCTDGGYYISWELLNKTPFTCKVKSSDWVGPLAAQGRTTQYIWVLYRWIPIHYSDSWIS